MSMAAASDPSPTHLGPPTDRPSGTTLTVAGLYGLALVLRLTGMLAAFDPELRFDKFFVIARALIADGWAPAGPFSYAPLYTYLVAAAVALGLGPTAVAAVQVVLGSAVAPLVWAFARRFAGKGSALLAGLAAALYGPFMVHDLSFESDGLALVLFVAFAAALVAAVERPRLATFGLAGLLLGLRLAQRPDALLVLPLLAVASWALARPRWSARQLVLRWGSVALAAALPVLPLTWHNWRATGELVPVLDSGGYVLYTSNGPQASGLGYYPPGLAVEMMRKGGHPTAVSLDGMDAAVARRLASLVAGADLSPRQASAFWTREGLRVMRTRGWEQLTLQARKVLYSLHRFEAHDNAAAEILSRRLAPLNALGMGVVAPLALVGLALLARERPRLLWLLLALLASPMAKLSLFYVVERFRLELAALLLAPAAYCAQGLVARLRDGRRRAAVVMVVAVGVLAVPLNVAGPYLGAQATYRRILVHTTLAEHQGDPRRRVAELRAAVALATTPAQVEPALEQLGRLYLQLGNPAEAQRCLDLARGLLPPELQASLLERRDDGDALFALARHFTLTGDDHGVESALARAVQLDPLDPVLRYGLATARLRTGSAPPEEVFADLETALAGDLKLWREGIHARVVLAEHLFATGRDAEADELLAAARRLDSALPPPR